MNFVGEGSPLPFVGEGSPLTNYELRIQKRLPPSVREVAHAFRETEGVFKANIYKKRR